MKSKLIFGIFSFWALHREKSIPLPPPPPPPQLLLGKAIDSNK